MNAKLHTNGKRSTRHIMFHLSAEQFAVDKKLTKIHNEGNSIKVVQINYNKQSDKHIKNFNNP